MVKAIITTTINPPTEAIVKFDQMEGWDLIVVGDKKTPKDYKLKGGTYLTCEMQEKYNKKLSDLIGWNCIQRRNFGFLWALENGADIVAVVDDDNVPLKGWGENLTLGKKVETNFYTTKLSSFDPVGATNYPNIWHRGYPLQLISKRDYSEKQKKSVIADIQADFWNGDPDIDAICRMEHAPECKFDDRYFPIASNKISPFNSQNTFMSREVLKNYFLLPGIGRMDDIWASFYVQTLGFRVVYQKASVIQLRNKHDLTKDMKAEFLGYEYNLELIDSLKNDSENLKHYVPINSWRAFELYKKLVANIN